MRTSRCPAAALLLGFLAVAACRAEGFRVEARVDRVSPGSGRLTLALDVPPGHLVYADAWSVTAAPPAVLAAESLPAPALKRDPILGEDRLVFAHSTAFVYGVTSLPVPLAVTVSYMGCSDTLCYPPEEKTWSLSPPGEGATAIAVAAPAAAAAAAPAVVAGEWAERARGFEVVKSHAGYLAPADFLAFLESRDGPAEGLKTGRGFVWTMLLILVGGLALNLTPCVLPMIPVNVAILGAGAGGKGGRRGFGLGALYGAGMTLAYGGLGVFAVITKTAFGSVNASPVFNLGMAAVFVVLALSMFGLFSLDFSRFQARIDTDRLGSGRGATALVMGAVAALLAGACVAPVVISVLVLTSELYAAGHAAALVLPFLLGLGMALPWPLVGAGLSVLPKPGRWMEWVKVGFGVMILGFAAYYGWTGYGQLQARRAPPPAAPAPAAATTWHTDLAQGLDAARREGRPVFLDFWATWCKSCELMERTTFRDPEVTRALGAFVTIRYQAEIPGRSPAREVLDFFGVRGLPTFVVLNPRPADPPAAQEKSP